MESEIQQDLNDELLEEVDNTDLKEEKQSIPIKTSSSISLKKQPEQLCNCPSRCDSKIDREWRTKIYQQFSELEDHAMQNLYIQRHIKIKSIAKRLWEDEIVDKKIQRRVTCKYFIPVNGTLKDSFRYAKTLDYDNVKYSLIYPKIQDDLKKDLKVNCNDSQNKECIKEIPNDIGISSQLNGSKEIMDTMQSTNSDVEMDLSQTSALANSTVGETSINSGAMDLTQNSRMNDTSDWETSSRLSCNETFGEMSKLNGAFSVGETSKLNGRFIAGETSHLNGILDVNTFSDNVAMDASPNNEVNGTAPDTVENKSEILKETISDINSPMSSNDNESAVDESVTEFDSKTLVKVKYVEVCQKAFMNMYGITEKRIRWQREKLILKSRYLAEKKRKEFEEMDRTLALARSLGAGCQPLFALLEKSNCKQLSEQLLIAIEDDVALVNNFFHNQLWKPEDMNKSVSFSNFDSFETECD